MKTIDVPKDGLTGLKQHWVSDSLSGFLVFLLTLPLSLGIAAASGFPAAMGVLTAMIGGLVVSIFQGGRLTIKGPAAGLITVCFGAVETFDAQHINGATGVQIACGVIIVMAAFQFLFGVLKFGSYSDFFPSAVVHGMLAAIGLLIFAKQFPVLIGIDSSSTGGLTPGQLFSKIPTFILHANPEISLIGILSLIIIFVLPAINGVLKKIPAPLMVLIITIPLAIIFGFKKNHPDALVTIGNLWSNVGFDASFAAINQLVFWKYVLMFLFVSSLESLLSVKAIDKLDPYKRKSDCNKDLRALALGNGISGLLGGLPMISEVARSSANVSNGAKTRWANFFHGLFLVLAMLLLIPVLEMIPTAALAAMLIAVAWRLAAPGEFAASYRIGTEQLVIFLITIVVTIYQDLLIGVAAGIIVKFLFTFANGVPFRSLFNAQYNLVESNQVYTIKVRNAAIFSNFLGYKKMWDSLSPNKKIVFDFSEATLVDHSFMEQLHLFEDERRHAGPVTISGLELFTKFSSHPLAGRKRSTDGTGADVERSPRQTTLRLYAANHHFKFSPQEIRNAVKYEDFPIQKGGNILYEEHILEKKLSSCVAVVSDITLTEGAIHAKTDTQITVLYLTETGCNIPDFALEPEGLWSSFSELVSGKDIDFQNYPVFSEKYYLRSENEEAVRTFFSEPIIRFLEKNDGKHIECHNNTLLLYSERDLLPTPEITKLISFAEEFIKVVNDSQE